MRQRALPALISSKAQSKRDGERRGEKWRKGGSTNLERRSETPENIGHWPIFIEEKRRFAECKNSTADFNIFF